jgi:transglutaminase-like putative cysteine protease
MTKENASIKRSAGWYPVIAAVVFQAIVLERWPIAILAIAAGLWAVLGKHSVGFSLTRLLIAAALGGLAGLVSMVTSIPPAGLMPPMLTSVCAGALVMLSVFFLVGEQFGWAWICAWGLIALSANAELTTAANSVLILFLGVSTLAAAFQSGVFDAGRRVLPPLIVFAVLVGVATFGFSQMASQLERVIQAAIEGFYDQSALPRSPGVGDEILIGSRSSISLSKRVLFELSDQTGPLRLNVMDRFDGHRWSSSMALRSTEHSFSEVTPRPEAAKDLQLFLFEVSDRKLPSPAGVWEVRGAEARLEGGWVLRGDPTGTTIELVGDRQERLPRESASDSDLLYVPESLREGLAAVAERVTNRARTNRERAEGLEAFFHEHFEYSLDTDLMGPDHPLIQLVRERRPAYCVYFASAMTLMLRTQGIPARVVSGYLPVESNPITGRVTVRRRDSHAWVEAWLPDEGRFIAFDPTPTQSRQRVLGVNDSPGYVSALFAAVTSFGRRQWLNYRENPAGFLESVFRSPLLWGTLLGLLCLLFVKRWTVVTAKTKERTREAVDPQLQRVYQRYLRALQRSGVTPKPAETDDELIERLNQLGDGSQAAKATDFITIYRRVRFRGEPFDERLLEMAKLE